MIVVSCCNKNGAIFTIDEQTFELVCVRNDETRGIVYCQGRYYACNNRGLVVYDENFVPVITRIDGANWHGIRVHNGAVYAVVASDNAAICFDLSLNKKGQKKIDLHTRDDGPERVNDIFWYDGKLFYSIFYLVGDQYQKRNGAVMCWPGHKVVMNGLTQPHSVFVHNGDVYVCDSANMKLLQNGVSVVETDSYTRGVYIDENSYWVGLSKFRHDIDGRCGVIRKDRKSGVETFIELPAEEVYGIERVMQ